MITPQRSAPATSPDALSDWVERHGNGRAVGWHVRDMIDFPLAEALIDTFELPQPAQRGRRMLYVVVARRTSVLARADQLARAGLTVEAIDIPELAQREVPDRLATTGGRALLALGAANGLLTVYRDGEVSAAG